MAFDKPGTYGNLPLVMQLATLSATVGGALSQLLENGTGYVGLCQRLVQQCETTVSGGYQVSSRQVVRGANKDVLCLGRCYVSQSSDIDATQSSPVYTQFGGRCCHFRRRFGRNSRQTAARRIENELIATNEQRSPGQSSLKCPGTRGIGHGSSSVGVQLGYLVLGYLLVHYSMYADHAERLVDSALEHLRLGAARNIYS